ncbi:acetoin utilization protein AcuC [Acidimangrovimonas sediminis]|uniref:acetoin utilization protein AcuC n=1 Tax=Acidimangrovimonas sediminis TaxID=2056283 RepID=UPI000C803788|nr:acetoin utilization protein AcuC [Acidimangrovimonas sediminis]
MPARFISSEIYRATGYRGNHPLAIQRIGPVLTLSEQLGWLPDGYEESYRATRDDLLKFHASDYIDAIAACEREGRVPEALRERYRIGTLENPLFPGLYARASTSVGGSVQCARLALDGGVAYHPSGGTHHGMRDYASGFCYFNDPVFAVLTFLEAGLERVLYVDLDAHHGDGVEAAFAGDPRVMTISIHEENRWPFSGALGDRAGGSARNLPVPGRMNDTEFDYLMTAAVLPLASRFAPQAVVITCGADALKGDPLSSLELSSTALWDAVMSLTLVAPHTAVLGGGGYNPWTVARLWTGLWGRLAGYPIPETLPEESRALLRSLDCDLVDEEDEMQPHWTTTLADPRNDGAIRDRFREIAAAVLAPEEELA